jgi:hypothetical protein
MRRPREGCQPTAALGLVLQDAPQRAEAVSPADLLSLGVGAA